MLYLLILPMLLSLVLIPILGERIIRSSLIAIIGALSSFLLSVFYFWTNLGNSTIESYNWISGSNFMLSFRGDNLTLALSILVSFVSLMVLVFSVFYMRKEDQARYYAEMSLFIFSMLGLVLSNSTLLFYIFWEIVGVSSYLLIGFWYKKESASAAGKKALVLTRIGDMALFAAIIILFVNLNTFSIPNTLSSIGFLPVQTLVLVGALILIAALSKSAQFPFYTWLPDAMEGPTPVSALLHSATMVAAGVYLLVVMSPLLLLSGLDPVIVTIGMFTAFLAAFLALNHTHFKRILAYSTIESLSFMFIAVGTLNTGGAIFYLVVHALFKSMLFLIAGVLAMLVGLQDIHALRLKKLGKTWLLIPASIGFASLAGLPPFASFFAHASLTVGFNMIENILFVFLAFLTALFSFRLFFIVFGKRSSTRLERSPVSAIPIYLLSLFSVVGGVMALYFTNLIPSFAYSFDLFTLCSFVAAVLGVVTAFEIFGKGRYDGLLIGIKLRLKFLFDHPYDGFLTQVGSLFIRLGAIFARFDDMLSAFYDKLADSALLLSSNSRRVQNGDTQTYVAAILVGLVAILIVASAFI
ncbi:hypothetical protein M1316_01285 [Candidatus Parvarchaeota archaeon]|nr:hypothetical protein [Candidatus Parvarchaeota archaeon]